MEQKIILQNNEQCIYFMKDTNLDFYLVIPNNREISIVLGLFPNVSEDIIKSLPKEKDKAIIIPVISEQILVRANQMDITSFKYIDNVLSYLINVSYKILTHNKLNVNNKIFLNNHTSYDNFNKQYIQKYQGRVELYNLFSKPISDTTNNQNSEEVATFKPVEPLFKDKTINNKNEDNKEENTPVLYDDIVNNSNVVNNKEPGFVSYVLLGVLIAVIALVALYMVL